MRWVWAALGLSLFLPTLHVQAALLAVDEPAAPRRSEEQQRVAALVEQLDHEKFVKRKAAETHLLLIGSPAIDQITAATHHYNAEIRYRAQRLLAVLSDREVDQYMRSLDERILAFLHRSVDSALAGWDRFKGLVGDGPEARRLYADIHRAEPKLLWTYFNVPSGAEAARAACRGKYQSNRNGGSSRPPLGSLCAMQWLALDDDLNLSQQTQAILAPWWQGQDAKDVKQNPALLKLVSTWLDQPMDEEDDNRSRSNRVAKINLAQHFELKDLSIAMAIELLEACGDAKQLNWRGGKLSALGIFAEFGDKTHIKQVEPLLADETPGSWSNNARSQIRDVALGTLLVMTDQNLADYGLDLKPKPKKMSKKDFVANHLSFAIAKQRDDALARWQKWSKANP